MSYNLTLILAESLLVANSVVLTKSSTKTKISTVSLTIHRDDFTSHKSLSTPYTPHIVGTETISSSKSATMITDAQLYSLALFLGSAAMLLIVLYHFLEVNATDDEDLTQDLKSEKVGVGAVKPAVEAK